MDRSQGLPYGFFIDRSGNVKIVKDLQAHDIVAQKILGGRYEDPTLELLKRGWMRVVLETRNDTVFFETDYTYGPPTRYQLNKVKAMAGELDWRLQDAVTKRELDPFESKETNPDWKTNIILNEIARDTGIFPPDTCQGRAKLKEYRK